ncbi:glycosyltransferase family 1 protein [Patescibacteria group bacterium]|nr:MAG: glycosyltransferase family 1 protein [Patescibacteria group bacterium]
MKIIQANKFYALKGGAERYMLELSAWLETQGHTVLPFAMQHPDNREIPSHLLSRFSGVPKNQLFVSYVPTESTRSNPWQALRTVGRMFYSLEARRKLATLITQEKPDLAHIHNIYTQLSPSILDTLKDQHVPVVMTVHDHHLISPQYNIWAVGCGEDYRDVGIMKGALARYHKNSIAASLIQTAVYKFHRWLQIYEKNVDLFVCPSYYMKRQLIAGGFPQEKIRVNHYGIDPHSIQPRYDHDGSTGSPQSGYFLFVGRLSEEKGIETIVRAAKLIPDMTFKIVGRGPQMERLHRLADGITNIEFLGFRMVEELAELYRGAMAVLLPSRVQENFPLAILEAMAAGKPVIASHVGGVPEIVEDRVNGFLVNPADLNGWVEAIMRLAYDEELQRSMAHAARSTIEHRFRLDDHYRRLMAMYEEVVRSPSFPRRG